MLAFLALSAAISGPCDTPDARAFDFWVGHWAVEAVAAPGKLVAHSTIETAASGCAIRETWKPLTGGGGVSLSAFRPETKGWRQTWIDASGAWVEFKGGRHAEAMVLQGVWPAPGHPAQITRMTYTPRSGGAVEQRGETSDDGGRHWAPSFDFLYRPEP